MHAEVGFRQSLTEGKVRTDPHVLSARPLEPAHGGRFPLTEGQGHPIGTARPGGSVDVYDGISVYATETQARNQVRPKPWIGRYIAALRVTEDGSIAFRRTGVGRGHHTFSEIQPFCSDASSTCCPSRWTVRIVLEYVRMEATKAYEIWEMRTGNLVASFSTEEPALELVRDAMRQHGESYVLNLALVREDSDGSSTAVATAGELVKRARIAA